MMSLGSAVARIDAGRVPHTQRHDCEVWYRPGGLVDDGESLAQAAGREASVETGLTGELTGLVGRYFKTAVTGRSLPER